MDATEIIELYDSFWFEKEVLRKQITSSKSTSLDVHPDQEIQETSSNPKITRIPTISRSLSEKFCSTTSLGSGFSHSPDSVLLPSKLQTILSGKESTEEEQLSMPAPKQSIYAEELPKKKLISSMRRGKKTSSKSLSELEYEELKGFMDLGFVFSEEDKASELVSIIPGLQRLGKKEEEDVNGSPAVPRPYLSEAWQANPDGRKKKDPLINWRIPALNNEMDMKDNLKWWAQTVASTVR